MAFGSLVPGMAPMPIPAMQPNQMMKMGMQAMQQARGMQRPGSQPGQPLDLAAPGMPPNVAPQQGLLQRLLNPAAPPGPTGATPGMAPNAGSVPGPNGPMQMGLLAKLFPGMMGGAQPPGGMQPGAPPVMPQGDPTAGLGGLY